MNPVLKTISVCLQAMIPVYILGAPGEGKTTFFTAFAESLKAQLEILIMSLKEPSDIGHPVLVNLLELERANRRELREVIADRRQQLFQLEMLKMIQAIHQALTRKTSDVALEPALKQLMELSGPEAVTYTEAGRPDVCVATQAFVRRLNSHPRGLLVLDEITCANPSLQAAALRIPIERTIGETPLGENVMVALIGNPPDMAADGWAMTMPMINRVVQFEWPFSVSEWSQGMREGWPLPEIPALPSTWKEYLPSSRTLVAMFGDKNPTAIRNPPTSSSFSGEPWASPRSWDTVAKIIAACRAGDADDTVAIKGAVGAVHGDEFIQFRNELDIPDVGAWLRDPSLAKFNKGRMDIVYLLFENLGDICAQTADKTMILNAFKILAKAEKADLAEYTARPVQRLARRIFMVNSDIKLTSDEMQELKAAYKPIKELMSTAHIAEVST